MLITLVKPDKLFSPEFFIFIIFIFIITHWAHIGHTP